MDAVQTATTIGVSSVLAYPTWQGLKAVLWNLATRLWPDTDETPVDDTMALAQAANVTPIDHESIINWHAQSPALSDTSLEQTLVAWSTAAATVPAQPNTPEWYAEWDRLLATSPLPVDPETYLDPDDCRLCGGDGVYETRSALTGDLVGVTCPSCKGSGERGAR